MDKNETKKSERVTIKMYSFVNESHMFRYRNESQRKIPVVSGTCITPIHELYHDFVTTIRLIIISIRE